MAADQRQNTVVELTHLLSHQTCKLWCFDLERLAIQKQRECLSEAENARAEKFIFERDQRRFIAARAQLRALLSSLTGQPPHTLEFVEGSFGKPVLVGGAWAFNLSHSGDCAAVVASEHGHLGVDVEVLQQVHDAIALAEQNFTATELQFLLKTPEGVERDLAFLRGWTRKEACLKALGTGLNLPAKQVQTGLIPDCVRVHTHWQGNAVEITVESFQHGSALVGAVARVVTAQFSAP